MYLVTALGALYTIPAIVALVQEGKDNAIKSCAGLAIVLGVIISLRFHVGLVTELLAQAIWFQVFTITAAVLGVILVIRLRNRVVGTLIVTAGGLLALLALRVVRHLAV